MKMIFRAAARLHWRRMMTTTTTKTMNNPNPWLMLPPTFDRNRGGMVYNFYSVADNEVVRINKYGPGPDPPSLPDDDAAVVGSSHGWLALMNRRNNELFLSNPITRRHIKLPPIASLPNPEFNLDHGKAHVSKLILSASPDDTDCRAMVSFGPSNRLAFCRPGHSRDWAPIGQLFMEREDNTFGFKYARAYDDFVFSKNGNVFTCSTSSKLHDWSLEDWDLRSLDSPKINSPKLDWIPRQGEGEGEVEAGGDDDDDDYDYDNINIGVSYLVYTDEKDELFFINRLIDKCKTLGYVVCRVVKEGDWMHLRRCFKHSLGDMALFIGTNHAFAVSSPHLKPNSIYFTDDGQGRRDVGIYDWDHDTFSNCYYPFSRDHTALNNTNAIVPATVWFTPTLA